MSDWFEIDVVFRKMFMTSPLNFCRFRWLLNVLSHYNVIKAHIRQ